MKKFKLFIKEHKKDMQYIQSVLSSPDYHDVHILIKWMLNTKYNSLGYLGRFSGFSDYMHGFAYLVRLILHAVYDDGDINFILVSDEPRIVFIEKDKIDKVSVLTNDEIQDIEIYGKDVEIKILDIEPNEFGEYYDRYKEKQLLQSLELEVSVHGLEETLEKYKNEKWFKPEWLLKKLDT